LKNKEHQNLYCSPNTYYYADKIKEDDRSKAFSMKRKEEKSIQCLGGKHEERKPVQKQAKMRG
jgi:hypothetical protein